MVRVVLPDRAAGESGKNREKRRREQISDHIRILILKNFAHKTPGVGFTPVYFE